MRTDLCVGEIKEQLMITETTVGHCTLQWQTTLRDGANWLDGLVNAVIDNVSLKDNSLPDAFAFEGPEGVSYRSFRLCDITRTDAGAVLQTEAVPTIADTYWVRDQYDNDILHVGRPRSFPPLRVAFEVEPAETTVDGRRFAGFRLRARFSGTVNIGFFRWLQHWEIGGTTEGNTVYWQSQIASPVAELGKDAAWNNVCWKTLLQAQTPSNMSMQVNNRAGYHQLFDLIHARRGVLLAYCAEPASVPVICTKNPGEDNYFIREEFHFPLTADGATPWKTVLFHAGDSITREDMGNLWFDANRQIEDAWRAAYGIRKTRAKATCTHWMGGAVYQNGTYGYDIYKTGTVVAPEKYLDWLGSVEIPKAAAAGYERFWTRPYSVSDSTEMMYTCKAQKRWSVMDGDLTIGSCCCQWEYKPSAMYGGGEAAKRFYEAGHRHGLDIGIWVGNHLSSRAPVFKANPGWNLKDRNFANPAGGYDDQILAPVDWNSGFRDWLLSDLFAWKKHYGLDFIFFDSLGNLGLKCRNYTRADLSDNFHGICTFIGELTRGGIDVICEGRSFLGAAHFGIAFDGDFSMQSTADPLRGQNSLSWFYKNEDMLCGIECFGNLTDKIPPATYREVVFRGMAGGGYVIAGNAPENVLDFFRIARQVNPYMEERRLLPGGAGVEWRSACGTSVLFVFREMEVPITPGRRVSQVLPDGRHPVPDGERRHAEALTVWLSEA